LSNPLRLTPSYLDTATAALRAVLPLEFPADAILRNFFRNNPKLGPDERAFIAQTIFGILRRRFFLESMIPNPGPRSLLIAYLIKYGGLNLREVAPFLSERETKWATTLKAISEESRPLAIRAELPDWLIEKLRHFMTESAILALGRSLQQNASVYLRVNTLLASRENVLSLLEQSGITSTATPYSPVGIRLTDNPAVNRHELFLSGKVEVQDEGSQLLGYLVAPKRRDMVVDFCAGSGGKALMLGAMMHSQGRIYAFDTSEKRLNNLKPRLKRSGLSNLFPQLIAHEKDQKVKRLTGKIDRVLVDAPCSGLGTLRRNPDLKWRQSPQSIEELKHKQSAILSSAAHLLKPGGRLVYATCSFLPEENQQIVEDFLANNRRFTLLSCAELLAQQKIPVDTGVFLQLSPASHGTDGFFAAAMEIKQ
jgi:16S rRNA (cytosine967-C5)-methyltransferase